MFSATLRRASNMFSSGWATTESIYVHSADSTTQNAAGKQRAEETVRLPQKIYVQPRPHEWKPFRRRFDGKLYRELALRGFWRSDKDMAFNLTTDGFNLFRQRGYDCWPLVIINANLPP